MPRLRQRTLKDHHERFGLIAQAPFEIECESLSDYACRYGPGHWLSIDQPEAMRALLLNLSWLSYRSLLLQGWPREVCQHWLLLDEDPVEPLAQALRARDYDDAEVFADEHTAVADLFEGLGDPFEACQVLNYVLSDFDAQDISGDVRLDLLNRLEELQLQADLSEARLETTGALLALMEAEYSEDEERLLAAQISHASALTGCGHFEEAIQLSEATWERAQDLYADDLEMRMGCLVEYADTLMFAEQHGAAAELYQEAADTLEAALGPGAKDVRDALTGLAQCCDPMTTDDIEILEDVLDRTVTELGPDDDQVAIACHQLAFRLIGEDPERALELAERAEEISRVIWGPSHPMTLEHIELQGQVFLEQDEAKEALTRFEAVFEARKVRLGEENPALKASYENLSTALKALERFDEAIECAQKVVEVDERLQGDDHPDRVFVLGPLLSLYELAGAPDKADALFDEAKALLGENDLVTLTRRLNLYEDYGLEWAEIREDEALSAEVAQSGLEVATALEDVPSMAHFAVSLSWLMLNDEGPKAVRALWAELTEHVMNLEAEGDWLFSALDELLDLMDEALPKDKDLGKEARTLMDAWTNALCEDAEDASVYDEIIATYEARLKRHKA